MTTARIAIARRDLYNQLWAEPATKVAAKYGITDVALAKTCRRHSIPRPPRGYWARIQAGQKPAKSPLPDPEKTDKIMMRDPTKVSEMAASSSGPGSDETKDDEIDEIEVDVSQSFHRAHALVVQANEVLQSCDTVFNGVIYPPRICPLNVRVSKASLRRTLLIVDSIFKALEKRGCEIGQGPVVIVRGISISFMVREGTHRERKPAEVKDLSGPYHFQHGRIDEKTVPTGRLSLVIEYWGGCMRKTWSDGKRKKLEQHLGSVISGLETIATWEIERKAAREREERERQKEADRQAELERQRLEAIRRIEEEEQRVSELIQESEDWQASRLLRRYIAARVRIETARGKPVVEKSNFGRWVSWATQQADSLDPLVGCQPRAASESTGAEDTE